MHSFLEACFHGRGRNRGDIDINKMKGEEKMKVISFERAGGFRRIIAFWLDCFVLSFILPSVISASVSAASFMLYGFLVSTQGILDDKAALEWGVLLCTPIVGLVHCAVWAVRDVMMGKGKSIGKYLLNMKVYEEGERFVQLKEITLTHSILRNLVIVVLNITFYIALGFMLSNIAANIADTLPDTVSMDEVATQKALNAAFAKGLEESIPSMIVLVGSKVMLILYLILEEILLFFWGTRIGDMLAGTMVVLDE